MSVLSKEARNELDYALYIIGNLLEQLEDTTSPDDLDLDGFQAALEDASCALFTVIEEDGEDRQTDNE